MMFGKLTLGALPALVLAAGLASPALAAAPAPECAASVQEVQKAWDAMYPMGMQQNGEKGVADALRMAKEKCAEGDAAAAQQFLNVVRGHLKMAEHPAPHAR